MWILIYLMLGPGGYIIVQPMDIFQTYEQCIVAMHESEIAINLTSQAMVCVEPDKEDRSAWQ